MTRDKRNEELDYSKYVISTEGIEEDKHRRDKDGLSEEGLRTDFNAYVLDKYKKEYLNPDNPADKLNEETVTKSIIKLVNTDISDITHEKLRLEAMLLYYNINNEAVKIERKLKDVKNAKLILVQKYDRAKENLMLHDRILATQASDTRKYYGILCAIYDSVVKYTLPSAEIVSNLSKIQTEIEEKEAKRNTGLMETISESLQPLNFKCKSEDVSKMFEEMASFIEQNRDKYLNLEKNARDIYATSIHQRDIIQKDVTVMLENMSELESKIIEIESDYNKVKANLNQLLNYMQEKLEIQIQDNIPILS